MDVQRTSVVVQDSQLSFVIRLELALAFHDRYRRRGGCGLHQNAGHPDKQLFVAAAASTNGVPTGLAPSGLAAQSGRPAGQEQTPRPSPRSGPAAPPGSARAAAPSEVRRARRGPNPGRARGERGPPAGGSVGLRRPGRCPDRRWRRSLPSRPPRAPRSSPPGSSGPERAAATTSATRSPAKASSPATSPASVSCSHCR